MKKILMALTLLGLAYSSAEAQTKEVCRVSKGGASCYKTKYAENFKVCKNGYGYHICGEVATRANSTRSPYHVANQAQPQQEMVYADQNTSNMVAVNTQPADMLAPQSQSYPAPTAAPGVFGMSSEGTYEGYYPKKNYIKVSYSENNVAEETHAPYEGLPSPQDDGPEKNRQRNLNESNPNADLAPIGGEKY